MTTLQEEKIRCSLCGTEAEYTAISSTSTFGSPDLDTRPSEMERSTISAWVQRCPICGYCASNISADRPEAQAVIIGQEYKDQLTDQRYSELAASFLCKAIIERESKDFREATWALIHAAWACDDSQRAAEARSCRQRAADMLVIAEEHGQQVAEQNDGSTAILVDLLRRSGQIDKARQVISARRGKIADDIIADILDCQTVLLDKNDLSRHTVAETLGEIYFEKKRIEFSIPEDDLTVPQGSLEEYICPILEARFVLIPAGTFMMGLPEDETWRYGNEILHQVTISKPFYMQTTPLTQEQWQKVMGNNPSYFKGYDKLPVESVSWNDVQNFIRKVNMTEGSAKYRLPTEAEWEYACRAGSTTAYCFGDDPGRLGEYAWYDDNSGGKTYPVRWKKPNAWGLYDMHGNVGEWVQDWAIGDYSSCPETDPTGPSSGMERLFRGGCWSDDTIYCRSAHRFLKSNSPDHRHNRVGFRLLRMFAVSDSPFIDKSTPVSDAIETGRDWRFIAYNDGTVLDNRTNLMWAAKDNGSYINWTNAKSYCENYRGGEYTDWRMPRLEELAGLYDEANTCSPGGFLGLFYTAHLTEMIRLTSVWQWASTEHDDTAFSFDFSVGTGGPCLKSKFQNLFGKGSGALPVRSNK